jgi:hypothetical protein
LPRLTNLGRPVNATFRCEKAKNQVEIFNLSTKKKNRINQKGVPAYLTREEVNSMPKTLAVQMAAKYFGYKINKNQVLDNWVVDHFGNWTNLRKELYNKVKDL